MAGPVADPGPMRGAAIDARIEGLYMTRGFQGMLIYVSLTSSWRGIPTCTGPITGSVEDSGLMK
jgi:hypothetical protein